MKKVQLLALFLLPLFVMAQHPEPPRPPKPGNMPGHGRRMNAEHQNRLQALSIAHLTKELQLTAEEAEKFWPVYNKYTAEVKKASLDSTKKDVLEKQQEVLNIRKKYNNDFRKILSAERTQKLFKSEQEFRNLVRKELEHRRREMDSRRKEMDKRRKEMEQRRKKKVKQSNEIVIKFETRSFKHNF